eukprot:374695-Pyramimonas_sp.AAC.1
MRTPTKSPQIGPPSRGREAHISPLHEDVSIRAGHTSNVGSDSLVVYDSALKIDTQEKDDGVELLPLKMFADVSDPANMSETPHFLSERPKTSSKSEMWNVEDMVVDQNPDTWTEAVT